MRADFARAVRRFPALSLCGPGTTSVPIIVRIRFALWRGMPNSLAVSSSESGSKSSLVRRDIGSFLALQRLNFIMQAAAPFD